jgi:low temperature requirement protein LtrA
MSSRPATLLRRRNEPLQASFLELFFDLAFGFALRQMALVLLAELSLAGAARTTLLLLPLWWAWVVTAWFSDWFDRTNRRVRTLLVGVTLGVLLMGVAVPDATGSRAWLFAGAYVAIHVCRSVATSVALRGHPLRRRTLRILAWFAASGVLWLAGAAWPAVRVPAWVAAVAADYAAPRLGWPIPGLGRAQPGELRLRGGHLKDRYQQVFIIALGELIATAGVAYAATGLAVAHSAAFLLVFAAAVLIGLLYVTPAGGQLGAAIDERDPARFGTVPGYLHLVMIAGVVALSGAAELAITHPAERGSDAAILLTAGGSGLFLAGRVALSAVIDRRLSWPRLLGLPALLLIALAGHALPLLGIAAATVAVLLVLAVPDRWLARAVPGARTAR